MALQLDLLCAHLLRLAEDQATQWSSKISFPNHASLERQLDSSYPQFAGALRLEAGGRKRRLECAPVLNGVLPQEMWVDLAERMRCQPDVTACFCNVQPGARPVFTVVAIAALSRGRARKVDSSDDEDDFVPGKTPAASRGPRQLVSMPPLRRSARVAALNGVVSKLRVGQCTE